MTDPSLAVAESSLRPVPGRGLFFAALYFSEGAPMGFIWWALPTMLRAAGIPLGTVTALTAALVFPWMLKFLWAPVIDRCRSAWWNWQHWILLAQSLMVLTLLPLASLDLQSQLGMIRWLLLAHAFAAATQDVAIDGLCMAVSHEAERGRLNGWMQAGMLLGRSLFGGGSLILLERWGQANLVLILAGVTAASSLIVIGSMILANNSPGEQQHKSANVDIASSSNSLGMVFRDPRTWLGLAFALTGGAAFEALGAVQGPLLLDKGYSTEWIGWVQAVPNVIAMVIGGLLGGVLADRIGHRSGILTGVGLFTSGVCAVGIALRLDVVSMGGMLTLFAWQALGIGVFTAASYAWLMDLSVTPLAATRFSLFMGATNGCEIWSGYSAGQLIPLFGVGSVLALMSGVSILASVLFVGLLPAWTALKSPSPESQS